LLFGLVCASFASVHVAEGYRIDPSHGLAVETVATAHGVAALEPEWRALEPSLPALPFNRYDWASAWWRAFGPATLKRRNELRVLAFRSAAGALVGVAPMMRTSWPARGPVRARTLQFFGNDPNLTELRGPAFHPSFASACFEALFAELGMRVTTWDWLRLSGLPAELGLGALAHAPVTCAAQREIPSYVLELPETWAALKAGLSRNTKEAIRKCYNAPKRDGVELEFEVVTSGPALLPALDDFFRLHAGRAERSDTVVHANAFARPEAKQFLQLVCGAFAEDGRLKLFLLRARGKIVAARIAFALGDTLYLYYSGYSSELAQYSVMTRLVCETLQYAIAHGFRRANLSTGTDASKLRWGPSKLVHRDVELVSSALTSRVLYGAFTWTSRAIQGEVLPRLRAFRERHERASRDRGVSVHPAEERAEQRTTQEPARSGEDRGAHLTNAADEPPQSTEIAAQ